MSKPEEPVFFDIPKPGAARQKGQPPQYQPNDPFLQRADKPGKQVVHTKINRITFRGGMLWAAVRYFFWGLLIPSAMLIFMEYQWSLLSEPPANKFVMALPYVVILLTMLFLGDGIISIIANRFTAFAVFLDFFIKAGVVALFFRFGMIVFRLETLPTSARVWACILVLYVLIVRLRHTAKFKNAGGSQMNSVMLRLKGAPGMIFFAYLLRSMVIPLLAASIVWIFGLSINPAWRAIFYIYGFLWAYEAVRVTLKCLEMKLCSSEANTPLWIVRIILLLYMEVMLLFLPIFGWFLMWYFHWLPMPTWTIWLYSIYGFFVLWYHLGFLSSMLRNK